MEFVHMASPLGTLRIEGNENGITAITFRGDAGARRRKKPPEQASLRDAVRQLTDYFAGTRDRFDLPLAPEGTPFQRSVWREIRKVPYGQTITYAELARRVGRPKGVRAVGAANGRNPIPILIPCHRIIGSNGNLTGYAGGLEIKRMLLEHEGAVLL